MKGEVIILKNIPHEGPGLIETLLLERRYPYRIIEVDERSSEIPTRSISALIVMGGPASANDKTPVMQSELELIRKVVEQGIPYLGICLGLQTLVKALGGEVIVNHNKEIGFRSNETEFYNVKKTPLASSDRLLNWVPESFKVFQLHGETVIPAPGMKILCTGDICTNQIVKVGENAYGLQFHPELTAELLNDWIKMDTDLKLLNPEILRTDFEIYRHESEAAGRSILQNFLGLLFN